MEYLLRVWLLKDGKDLPPNTCTQILWFTGSFLKFPSCHHKKQSRFQWLLLTRTWKNISMSATNAILSCLNLIKVPTVWLVRSGPCWLIFRHTLCCNQKQLESYWVWLDGTLHVEANTTLFHQLVYLWKSQHTMHKNFFHKFLVVMKILSLI